MRVGVPLADDHLEFLAGRRRPNTVLAAGYDLRVFLAAVGANRRPRFDPGMCWGSSPLSAPAARSSGYG